MNVQRVERIEALLRENLSPEFLEIEDDSHHHAGHAGAKNGAGHFSVKICSRAFIGQTPIKRHRMVYAALASMMDSDIHALSIDATVPTE
ncbi:BolA family protein [Wohlfahrtiimonas chitiniclastica]|uniref:BolA family protein n=1 Tax=Wohlfahrtiimonas chitiniclastica TaxID=400946 RepID=UPI001BCABB8F|nr:BolA family protein [Wohlfahrtiimonas chitiniclastica]MBS7816785.1 BolA family transcriptional regulator [Wohlfahrtiimonas chitiniclastica]MBS7822322.1 BolA family transcriptional regulator [Wohlfahrtiimonas chitiniclastica]MBS7830384.1 BolA family transcriptional regulator [Wohlfahrtiimonas chitiniclastica]MBS7832352.1 BolA family transcriptional regulator [Wohlfahrtiimonas chitiniclastica]